MISVIVQCSNQSLISSYQRSVSDHRVFRLVIKGSFANKKLELKGLDLVIFDHAFHAPQLLNFQFSQMCAVMPCTVMLILWI